MSSGIDLECPVTADEASATQKLYLWQTVVLMAGFLSGVAFALSVSSLQWDFSSHLVAARELGIMSLTIQQGYPKFRDVVNYAVFLLFPTVSAIGFWLVWAKGRRQQLARMVPASAAMPVAKSWGRRIFLLLIIATYLYVSFGACVFVLLGSNESVGYWAFLGEEGENLAWAQMILNGGVYARDFFCLYGPMLIYPMVWTMKLFGTTVLVARSYTYFLDLLAYAVYITVFYRTIRSRLLFTASSLVFLAIFNHGLYVLSPNTTFLRVALGILPLYLLFRGAEQRSNPLYFAAGVIAGQSLLFSQEVGICACLAMAVMLMVQLLRDDTWQDLLRKSMVTFGAVVLSLLPMLLFLAYKGALVASLGMLYEYPRLVMLGYGGISFPEIGQLLSSPFSGVAALSYWLIFFYALTSVSLLIRVFLRKVDGIVLFRVGLTIFGVLLYRSALGRSDIAHILFAAPPAMILSFISIDQSLASFNRESLRLKKFAILASLVTVTGSLILVAIATPDLLIKMSGLFGSQVVREDRNMFLQQPKRLRYGSFERSGLYFPSELNKGLLVLKSFLDKETKPGDYILFMPNEAAYYFLFNRNSPTRFVHSYFAVTRAHRQEMIADIERRQPEYVVISDNTWRIDNIPEQRQVPELVEYLEKNYVHHTTVGNFVIARRKNG